MNKPWIYESPDKGKTVYRRRFGGTKRELVKENVNDDSKDRNRD